MEGLSIPKLIPTNVEISLTEGYVHLNDPAEERPIRHHHHRRARHFHYRPQIGVTLPNARGGHVNHHSNPLIFGICTLLGNRCSFEFYFHYVDVPLFVFVLCIVYVCASVCVLCDFNYATTRRYDFARSCWIEPVHFLMIFS